LEFEAQAMVEAHPFERGSLRIVVTAGIGAGLERTGGDTLNPTKIIYYGPVTKRSVSVYEIGVSLKRKVAPWIERNPRIKLCHYAPEIVAIQRAKKEGYDDILWSRDDGELMEASVSNLFLIARQGDQVEIATPPAHSGILLGVTRQKVIDLLYDAKIPVTEQIVYNDELPRFDEGFLSSSLSGLVPIKSIDRHQFHTARSGSTFRHIERLYRTWLSIFETTG
jgi:branched-subunit amino acid aminotransferase/4-amino-4-deoxychorismate lyase